MRVQPGVGGGLGGRFMIGSIRLRVRGAGAGASACAHDSAVHALGVMRACSWRGGRSAHASAAAARRAHEGGGRVRVAFDDKRERLDREEKWEAHQAQMRELGRNTIASEKRFNFVQHYPVS